MLLKNKKFLMTFIVVTLSIILSQQTVQASSFIDNIVNQISQTDYTSYVQDLEGFGTRYYNTAGNVSASNYIYGEFASYGLSVAYDPFTYSGNSYNNVVATLPGTKTPDDIYIIGAHFDSRSPDPQNTAPGADDNASGVGAVLEMASVLSQYDFRSTIKFIAFNVEEMGLKGSKAYANEAEANGDNILAMLNFDMIAYTGYDLDLEIMGDPWLVDEMISNAELYTSLPTEAHYGNVWGSDHFYFHSTKYPGSSSILSVENTPNEIWEGANPYYHTTGDISAHLDFDFAIDVTKIGAATIANLALPIPEPSTLLTMISGLAFIGGFIRRKSQI